MISELKNLTIEYLANEFDITEQVIPEKLKSKQVNNGSKVFSLKGDGYEINDFAHINTTLVETNGTEIFNLIIFPDDENNLPIFASEILIFGGKLYLAVIDIEHTWTNNNKIKNLYDSLGDIFEKYSYLPHVKEIPDWAKEYFSEMKIYIRPGNTELIDDIKNVYIDYLKFYADYIKNESIKTNLTKNNKKINDYKVHHALNSPGLNYLSRIFGNEWTEDYLNLFMYKVR